MDFRLTEEQKLVRDTARDFVDRELIPHVREWEEKGEVPRSFYRKMASLGFLGAPVPEKYGGAGMDYVSFMLLVEEISRGSSSVRTTVSVQTSLSETSLMWFGTEAQKEKWLVPLAKGERFGAWAITEPEAGSDAGNLATTAKLEGNEWVLNGQKRFISNGSLADYVQVYAREPGTKRHEGISLFLVPKDAPGFKVTHVETTTNLGLRASPTADLAFEDCRIPKENLIGKKGDGWNQAMRTLNSGRIGIAAGAVGVARAALEAASKYVKDRKAFGRPIGDFQLIREMIAQSAVEIDAARLLTLRAAHLRDLGQDNTIEVSMAKLYGAQMAQRVTDWAVQVHGGYGFSGDFDVERDFRHARERHPVRSGQLLPRERGGSRTGGVPRAPPSDPTVARRWFRVARPPGLWPHRRSHRARRARVEDPHGVGSLTGLKSVPSRSAAHPRRGPSGRSGRGSCSPCGSGPRGTGPGKFRGGFASSSASQTPCVGVSSPRPPHP